MRELRRYQLANGEVVYSVEGFKPECIVVYCEHDDAKWKISRGMLTTEISDYGLAMKHIANLGTVRTEWQAQNVSELVLTEQDLPEFETSEIIDRISGSEEIQEIVDR
jgi:hypothetical protein